MKLKSLHKRHSELANAKRQLEILSNGIFLNGDLPKFKDKIAETSQYPLKPKKLEVKEDDLDARVRKVLQKEREEKDLQLLVEVCRRREIQKHRFVLVHP